MENETKVDLILHPIRLRITIALSGGQKTSRKPADKVRDIPQATLTAEEAAGFGKDDHLLFFIGFIATLLDDFSRLMQHCATIDLTKKA